MMGLLVSRKFVLLVISLLALVLNHATEIEIDSDELNVAAGLIASYLVAQGIADNGAGGTTRTNRGGA